jgi:hypothetical protein
MNRKAPRVLGLASLLRYFSPQQRPRRPQPQSALSQPRALQPTNVPVQTRVQFRQWVDPRLCLARVVSRIVQQGGRPAGARGALTSA